MRSNFLVFLLAFLVDSTMVFGQCTIDVQPSTSDQSTCINIAFNNSISILVSGSNLSYQWYSNNVASNSGGAQITSATSSSFSPPSDVSGTEYYYCVVSENSIICATSNVSGLFTVNPLFNAGSINLTGETICYNGNPSNITSSSAASGGDAIITYKWQANGVDIPSTNSATYDPTTGLTATTTYTRWAKDGTCNAYTQSTGSWVVTVNNQFSAGAITGPATSTQCYNYDPTTLTANPIGGAGTYSYQWQSSSDGTNWNNIASQTNSTYDPPALTSTTYYRVLVDATGSPDCGSSTVSTNTFVYTIHPQFTAGAINTTGETICYNGDPASITSSSAAIGGDNTITYKWQVNGVDMASTNSATYDPPANLTANTTYTRWAKDGTCNAFTQSTGSWVVAVNLSANANAGNYSNICAGESIVLNNGSIGGSAASSTWSGGTGEFSNSSNLNCTYYPSLPEESLGSVTLILTTNDPDGSGPCPAVSDSVTITINNADFVSANNTDTIFVCSGNETTLFGTGADFYIWSGGIQDSVPFVTQSSGWYEVTGYSSSTCFDNDFIYVHVLPSPEFALPSDTIVCSGVPFNVSNSNSNESINWTWNGSAVNIAFNPNTSGYLIYETSLQNECLKTDSIYLELIISPLPQITGDSILCSNASWMNYSVTNAGNQIEWQIVNGQIQAQEYNSIFVDFDSTIIASVIVIENIWGTTCKGSDTLSISLINGYALDRTQIQPLYSGSTVLYTTLDYPIMIWGFEPKSTNSETIIQNQSNQYCEFGNIDTVNYYYWVKIAANDSACLTKSYYNAPLLTSDISEVDSGNHLVTIYPNPAVEVLNIRNDGDDKIELILSDQAGRIIDQLFISGNTTRIINISEFESGYYYFHYSIEGIRSTKKFVKF